MRNYLLNSTAAFDAPKDNGVAERVKKERESIKVESVKIEDEEKEDEQKDEDGEEKEKDDGEEKEDESNDDGTDKEDDEVKEEKEETKDAERARKKQERIDRKFAKKADELKEANKKIRDLEAKLAADPEKGNRLTEEDVEARSEEKAKQKRIKERFDETADKLADSAQKYLKLTNKKFEALIDDFKEEVGTFPPIMIVALGKIKNGAETLAHILQNHDEAEDLVKLANDPVEMALELNALATKIRPKQKAISQAPDPVEPLGGRSAVNNGDFRQKGISDAEYIARRNADVAAKRAAGRTNLR